LKIGAETDNRHRQTAPNYDKSVCYGRANACWFHPWSCAFT